MKLLNLRGAKFWYRALLIAVYCLGGCAPWPQASLKPSPDPKHVRAILQIYPGGALGGERMFQNGQDPAVQITINVQTTPAAAIAYYDPLLKELGITQYSSKAPIDGGPPVDQAWSSHGNCPFHYITILTTVSTLEIVYVHGDCR